MSIIESPKSAMVYVDLESLGAGLGEDVGLGEDDCDSCVFGELSAC